MTTTPSTPEVTCPACGQLTVVPPGDAGAPLRCSGCSADLSRTSGAGATLVDSHSPFGTAVLRQVELSAGPVLVHEKSVEELALAQTINAEDAEPRAGGRFGATLQSNYDSAVSAEQLKARALQVDIVAAPSPPAIDRTEPFDGAEQPPAKGLAVGAPVAGPALAAAPKGLHPALWIMLGLVMLGLVCAGLVVVFWLT